MDGRRGRPVLSAAFGVLALFAVGCGTDAGGVASASAKSGAAHGDPSVPGVDVAGKTSQGAPAKSAAGPSKNPQSTSVTDLAPAGPAPGGVVKEAGEEHDLGSVSQIADSIGCEDVEGQQHLPVVSQQLSCRRGVERLYVMSFDSWTNRDAYLSAGPQVVTGGFNVVGPTWVVHVETQQTADEVQQKLQGEVRAGA
jgi:hypothetical protein